jgi:transposase-like protein
MAGRATYSEDAKAKVFAALAANDGNVKRTAREFGIPSSTIRRWRDDWEREKNLPSAEALEVATNDFMTEAKEVRNLAIAELKRKIPAANVSQLVATVGMLTDKIDRVEHVSTQVHEHKISLPSADEIAEALRGLQKVALESAARRDMEIVEAELVALPAAK